MVEKVSKFSIYWNAFKPQLIAFLKGKAVTFALKKLLGSAMAGGFKGWIVKYVVEQLFDEIFVPLIKTAMRKGELYVDQTTGKVQIKRLHDATDVNEYNDRLDDILR